MRPRLLAFVVAVLAVAGCSLKHPIHKTVADAYTDRGGGSGGRLIQPKMCKLTVAIVPRPLGDPSVNGAIWDSADEQVVGIPTRRVLEANGLRLGVITGGTPASVESAMKAPAPNTVAPADFVSPDGAQTMIALGEAQSSASLLLNRDGRAFGKDYKDAAGWFRVVAAHDGPAGVSLKFVPEIRHGPISRRYDASTAAVNAGSAGVGGMDFLLKDGQQEETLRDLAATVVIQPGQIAVVGCIPERKGSLGGFLFTQAEPHSDRLTQKVLIVWATRSNLGEPGSQPVAPAGLHPVEPPDLPLTSRVAAAVFGKEKEPGRDDSDDPTSKPKENRQP